MAITGFDNTYQKMIHHREARTLESLILMSNLERKRSGLFHMYWKSYQIGTHMSFKLVCVASSKTRKLATVGFGKHCKKRRHKSTDICSNMLQKKTSPKAIFLWFLRSPFQHGLQGGPREAPRPKSISKWGSRHGLSLIWGPCFHLFWRHFGNVSCVPWIITW